MKTKSLHITITLLFIANCFMATLVSAQAGGFIYTNNNISNNTVSAFAVGASGTLSEIAGSPFLTGGLGDNAAQFPASNRIRSVQTGNRLYVSNALNVSGFDINTATGELTAVPGSPFSLGIISSYGVSLAATPNGQFLYAGCAGAGVISAFSMGTNGGLTALAGSPYSPPSDAGGMVVSPNGSFLAVTLPFTGDISVYSVASNGALSQVAGSPFSTNTSSFSPTTPIFNSSGNLLFVCLANLTGTDIAVFNVSSSGSLTAISGSPFSFNTGGVNSTVGVLSSDDKFLFVSNQISKTVSAFSIGSSGSLTQVSGSPFSGIGGSDPAGMAISNDNSRLYVASANNDIGGFNIQSDGALSVITGFPFTLSDASKLGSIALFQPLTSSSNSPVCDGAKLNLYASGGGTSYKWTGPDKFTSTQQNPVRSKATAAMKGIYTVTITSAGGSSTTLTTNVFVGDPGKPGGISGDKEVCNTNDGAFYSIGPVAGATSYQWTVPTGATILSGQGSTDIQVSFIGAKSGKITVKAINHCSSSAAQSLAVTVSSCGRMIQSEQSVNETNMAAYPNPTNGIVTLKFEANIPANYNIEVFDMTGRVLKNEAATAAEGTNLRDLDLGEMAKGLYIISLEIEGANRQMIRVALQ